MRILTAFLVFIAILVGLLAGAVVALAGGPLPYVVLGIVIGAVIARRRRQRPPRQHPMRPRQHPLPPHQRPLPSGWVYVPVWVGPPPQPAMPVIEAEFVRDPRRG